MRKAVKASREGKEGKWRAKEAGMVKALVERVEESAKWVEEKRKGVGFGPGRLGEVEKWEEGMRGRVEEESPLGKYVKVLRKTRKKRKMATNVTRKLNGRDELELRPGMPGSPEPLPSMADAVSEGADADVAADPDEE